MITITTTDLQTLEAAEKHSDPAAKTWQEICDEALESPECEDPFERVAAHVRAARITNS